MTAKQRKRNRKPPGLEHLDLSRYGPGGDRYDYFISDVAKVAPGRWEIRSVPAVAPPARKGRR